MSHNAPLPEAKFAMIVRYAILVVTLIALAGCASAPPTPSATETTATPASCTFCPVVSPKGCTLCVESNPLLNVDNSGVTSGTLRLCNRATMPATLALDLSDFYARDLYGGTYPLSAVRTLSAASPANNPVLSGTSALDVNACIDVKVEASRIWQAGLSTADFRNRNEILTQLKAVRYQVPFNLKVDGATPEMVNVQFTKGRQASIRLRNEDAMAYRFLWRFELEDAMLSGEGLIAANGLTALPIALARSNFSFLESGFLRSAARNGTLTLAFEPDASFSVLPLPQKRYPVAAKLSYFGDTWQRIVNYIFVLVVLLAGIAASLLVNHVLPTQKKRVEIKERLAEMDGRLAGLGGVVDSRILSLLRVEKKRLREKLRELQALVPQTAVELPLLEARIDWLAQRIDLTSRAGELLAAIETESSALALLEADEIRAHCHEVLQVVAKTIVTQEEIESARKHLSLAGAVLDGTDLDPSTAAVQQLMKRGNDARKAVPVGPVSEKFKDFFLPLPHELPPEQGPMSRDEYIRLARFVTKAELILEFVRHVESSPDTAVRDKRLARTEELLKALVPGPDESIESARDIVRQVEQNVTRDDVERGIQAKGMIRIEVDPPTPLTYQLVTFRVRFQKPGLDCAIAQNEIQCKWWVRPGLTTNPNDQGWVEAAPGAVAERRIYGSDGRHPSGWTIGHFFVGDREWQKAWKKVRAVSWPRNRNGTGEAAKKDNSGFTVKAQFPELDTEILSEGVTLEGSTVYVESRTIVAVASLIITILVVAFGLLAGAQEKLQTLDWISGVVAVVVLGFGADTLKNLITRT